MSGIRNPVARRTDGSGSRNRGSQSTGTSITRNVAASK